MKLLTSTICFFLGFSISLTQLSAQCTTAPNGAWPASAVALNNNTIPKVLTTNCYCGEFSICSNVQSGKNYTVTSSVATDYITITDGAGTVLSGLFGTQPFSFTSPSAANIRVYRHLSSLCEEESVSRTISVSCTDCAPPPPPPVNNNCSGALGLNGGGMAGVPTGTPLNGSTLNATQSQPDCTGGNADDDVWYQFTTSAFGGDVDVTVDGDPTFDAVVQVFSSTGPCAGLVSLVCEDAGGTGGIEVASVTGLMASATYYVRVYDYYTGFTGGAADRIAGTFTIEVAGSALPVTLLSFTAKQQDKSNIIDWSTGSERNTAWHVIERSNDGVSNWTQIYKIAAAGTSSDVRNYRAEDKEPLAMSYYRLRSVDFDGTDDRSPIVLVARSTGFFGITSVFPTPTTSYLQMQYASESEAIIHVQIYDLYGRLVAEQQEISTKGINTTTLDLTALYAGTYTIQLSSDSEAAQVVKVVKQ
jgi:hypothetical protein